MQSYLGKLSLTIFEEFWVFLKATVGSKGEISRLSRRQWGNIENGAFHWKRNVGHSPPPAKQVPLFCLREGKWIWLRKDASGVAERGREGNKGMMREEWNEISMS